VVDASLFEAMAAAALGACKRFQALQLATLQFET
jgi:hypothetical protein